MTILDVKERCGWCGRALPERSGPGRPRQFCRQGCRQQAHMSKKLAAAHGLGDHDVIVDRQHLEELQGVLYCLQAAIEDVDRDLVGRPSGREVREALDWLLANARPAADMWIEASTVDSASLDIT